MPGPGAFPVDPRRARHLADALAALEARFGAGVVRRLRDAPARDPADRAVPSGSVGLDRATRTPPALAEEERRTVQAARLAAARRELAAAAETGQRSILVRALRNEIAALEQALSATASATRDGPPVRAR